MYPPIDTRWYSLAHTKGLSDVLSIALKLPGKGCALPNGFGCTSLPALRCWSHNSHSVRSNGEKLQEIAPEEQP